MNKPDWFLLIERWVSEGLGVHGVTLPFILGALLLKSGHKISDPSEARTLLSEISTKPVDGYVTEISWCTDIQAPVLNVTRSDSKSRMNPSVAITHPSGEGQSLVFGPNLCSRWNSNDPYELIERLVQDVKECIVSGKYSRIKIKGSTDFEWGDFLHGEISFIKKTIMSSQPPFSPDR